MEATNFKLFLIVLGNVLDKYVSSNGITVFWVKWYPLYNTVELSFLQFLQTKMFHKMDGEL